MLDNWGGEVLPNDMMTLLYRDVFYGNHLVDIRDLAALMGLKVVEEGQARGPFEVRSVIGEGTAWTAGDS